MSASLPAPSVPHQPARIYVPPPETVGLRHDMPVTERDVTRLMDHTVLVPLHMLTGMFPGQFWHRKSDLNRASADAFVH